MKPLILFQTTPGGVFAEPQQIAVDVGLLARYADGRSGSSGFVAGFFVFVDRVSIDGTTQFFAVTSINGGQIAVCQNRLRQTVVVHRRRGWQFGRARLKISNLTFYFFS